MRDIEIHDHLICSIKYSTLHMSVFHSVVSVIQSDRLCDSSRRKACICEPRLCVLVSRTAVRSDGERWCWRSVLSSSSNECSFKPLVNPIRASIEKVICLYDLLSVLPVQLDFAFNMASRVDFFVFAVRECLQRLGCTLQ